MTSGATQPTKLAVSLAVYRPFREWSWPLPLLRVRRCNLFRGVELTVAGFVLVVRA